MCKLHIPWLYIPLWDAWTCECGAVIITKIEKYNKRK